MEWDNKERVIKAVKVNGFLLQYASDRLKNDKEVVIEAIKENRNSLKYASELLRNDKELAAKVSEPSNYIEKSDSKNLVEPKVFLLDKILEKRRAYIKGIENFLLDKISESIEINPFSDIIELEFDERCIETYVSMLKISDLKFGVTGSKIIIYL